MGGWSDLRPADYPRHFQLFSALHVVYFDPMPFFRQWFVLWFALILGGGQLFASSREDRSYAAAVAAFNDKFYDRAAAGFTQFLQGYRKSTNAPAATLFLAQSEFYLGKYPAAITRLANTNNVARAKAAGLADQYLYWQAQAQFAGGNFQEAAQTFVSLADSYPNSSLALNSVVEAAASFGKLADWPQADALLDNTNGVFQRAADLDPASHPVADGRLLQAESKFAQRDFPDAIRILGLLKPATLTPEQDWRRAYQLYRANLRLNDLDAALAATTNLLQIARGKPGGTWATNLAESVVSRADVLEKQDRLVEAGAAWQENLAATAPVAQQQHAVLKMAELAGMQGNLGAAEDGLEKFLTQFPDAAAAGMAAVTLGELHLKDYLAQPMATNHLAAAKARLDDFLSATTNGPLAGKAYLDRGWCFWLANDLTNSLADFQAAAERLPASEDAAVARFKMGDAQFAMNDFIGAQTNYVMVIEDFSSLTNVADSLVDRALYQILRARLALHDTNGLSETMGQLLGKFLNSAPAERSLLLAGQGFSDFGSPAKAREVFRGFEIERADSPLLPQVEFAVGRTFEREQNWPAAVTNYDNWLAAHPTHHLRPQVEYARDWAVSQTDEAAGFGLFTNFLARYTSDPALTPLAFWWVADHYFRQGDTIAAEKNYQYISQGFPTNDLAYRAQFMAGMAAMARFNYKDARNYFLNLFTYSNCPEDLKLQGKFGYCEALSHLAVSDTNNISLETETQILAQIYSMAATNIAGALAWAETGDCNLQMGALDAATNAYAQAFTAAASRNQELWCRAKVGFGTVLEKKAEGLPDEDRKVLLGEALNQYLDVVYSGTNEYYVKKAGLNALPWVSLLESDEARQKFFDRLEALLPQMKNALEKKRSAPAKG